MREGVGLVLVPHPFLRCPGPSLMTIHDSLDAPSETELQERVLQHAKDTPPQYAFEGKVQLCFNLDLLLRYAWSASWTYAFGSSTGLTPACSLRHYKLCRT